MAGSFRSRLAIAALAAASFAAAAVATAVQSFERAFERVGHGWRRACAWFVDCFDALIVRIKPAKPSLDLNAFRRVQELHGANLSAACEKRRPLVSPRWRMCPSV